MITLSPFRVLSRSSTDKLRSIELVCRDKGYLYSAVSAGNILFIPLVTLIYIYTFFKSTIYSFLKKTCHCCSLATIDVNVSKKILTYRYIMKQGLVLSLILEQKLSPPLIHLHGMHAYSHD